MVIKGRFLFLRAMQLFSLLLLTALMSYGVSAQAERATVAVASNFAETAKHLAERFEKSTPHQISTVLASTGQLHAQITNGAPFDILLAADDETPARLVASGHAVPASQFTYAIGRLVLWSRDPAAPVADAAILREGRFNRLALANPQLAPYGAAALQTLQALKLDSLPGHQRIEGNNILQVWQYVSSGNAQVGFVALSQVLDNGKIRHGSGWIVPQSLHEQIRQDAILLKRAQHNEAALAFLSFLKSAPAREIIRARGYD